MIKFGRVRFRVKEISSEPGIASWVDKLDSKTSKNRTMLTESRKLRSSDKRLTNHSIESIKDESDDENAVHNFNESDDKDQKS